MMHSQRNIKLCDTGIIVSETPPKKHNLSNLPHQTVEKLQKKHGVLRGPQIGKQRWRARLGIIRVNALNPQGSEVTNLTPISRSYCGGEVNESLIIRREVKDPAK